MKFEKITEFMSEATTPDLLLTFAILIIIVAVIAQIFYTGNYIKKLYTITKRELEITNKHLAHIDHNNYVSDYDK